MCPSDLNKECTECCPVLTQAQNFILASSWNQVWNLHFLHLPSGTTHLCPADSACFPPMKRAKRKCWMCQCYTRPRCSLSPCCSLRQVPLRHLFAWKNGTRHRNRAATELAGHISSWLPGNWSSCLLTACSSDRHVTVFLPSEKDLGDKPALWFIWRLEEKSPPAFGFGFTHPFLGYCYDYRGSYYW